MGTQSPVLQMGGATLFMIGLSAAWNLLLRKTRLAGLSRWGKQVLVGISFGIAAALASRYGVDVGHGVILNVRDSAPLCAGLIFGGPAGLIAGAIGALHRWFCIYWGYGTLTRVACSLSTLLAGLFSGLMRRTLFENEKPGILSAFGIGATMEVLHMLLILATNLSDVSYAFRFVQVCAFPMILCNGLAVCLAVLACSFTRDGLQSEFNRKRLSYGFGFWLLICVVIAFAATSGFTQQVVWRITMEDADLYRHVTLYLVVFMEVLIYTALFILVYQLLKKKVICNLVRVNEGLNAITNGNLDTVINVRTYDEFAQLSDDVNATVSTLKHYIREAEERIDKELELARQIQHSALPSVFPLYPNRPDFDMYAYMDAAREVGGDFYDFYLLDSYSLVFMIADVSGKGIPAALFMMTAKTLIKGLAESGYEVEEIFARANRKLCESNDAGMFITAWMGKLDLRTGKVSFVNAGHNPPLLRRRKGQVQYLRTKPNFVLAGLEESQYSRQEVQLEPGDMIYLYTDGVTEAVNSIPVLYGEERLEGCLQEADQDPRSVCKKVTAEVAAFAGDTPQADDITMLCLKMKALHEEFSVTLYPDEESTGILQNFLEDKLEGCRIPQKVQTHIRIVFDEIWSNIVRYSGAERATMKLHFRDTRFFLEFRDQGIPYDPTREKEPDTTLSAEERDIGGLGLHMVRKLTFYMDYQRTGEENILVLGFKL